MGERQMEWMESKGLVYLQIRVTKTLRAHIRQKAKAEGKTISQWVTDILRAAL